MASDGREVAWLAYIPVPGVALIPILLRPQSRLVRFHAWQGGLAALGLLGFLVLVGLLTGVSDNATYRTTMGVVAGLGLLAALAQIGWAMVAAATGRFARVVPWWQLAVLLRPRD